MRTARKNGLHAHAPQVRVAVYCRVSTTERLAQDFNSLDNQRESVLAFIASQRSMGWTPLPERYDDGGFTGANTDRPAFQRLLRDVDAGRVDCVAVYKLDRFSRSLTDFVGTLRYLEDRGVAFCSVTQSFNTSTSMGRLTMNLLASFAEFERAVISERTRDKMVAARKRGMWTGGRPVLGYDVRNKKLVVNGDEADQVRQIFGVYLDCGSLLAAAAELRRRGWRTKDLTSQEGRRHAGRPYDKSSLRRVLTNRIYLGQVTCQGEAVAGAHEAIVDQDTWNAVQGQLAKHTRSGGREVRNKHGALLKGLVRCHCGEALGHHFTCRASKIYRFYICQRIQKQGAAACPGSRASAGELERLVVDRVRAIGRDAGVVEQVAAAVREENERRLPEITSELRRLCSDAVRVRTEREGLLHAIAGGGPAVQALTQRLADLDAAAQVAESRRQELQDEVDPTRSQDVDADTLRAALSSFDELWSELFPRERARVLALLIEQVTYDGRAGNVSIMFRPSGIRSLTEEMACKA